MYACKIVATIHVDALQVIWPLVRIAFDVVLLGQFWRHIFDVIQAKILTLTS